MRAIGVDLHKTMFMVCYLTGETKEFRQYKINEVQRFAEGLRPDDLLALETTGNTRYFVSQVKDRVREVVIINPVEFKIISKSVKKTDKKDAELIAFYLQKEMLPKVRMKDELTYQIKSLANTRDKLVKLRTILKNKLHNIMNAHGIVTKREEYSSEKGLKRILEAPINQVAKIEVEIIVEQIRHLNEGIIKIEKEMKERGSQLKGFENLTSIKGIGEKSATILLSIIGDINDFESDKKLSAYFGLVPRISQSNETIHYGRITKRGSKLGRTTLVQCSLIAKKYSPYIEKYFNRIKEKKGSGKAIIATARKLLGIIYMTLKEDLIYEDFPNFVLKS